MYFDSQTHTPGKPLPASVPSFHCLKISIHFSGFSGARSAL